MFKGFQDTSRSPMFHGFPNLNFQMNNEAYGFSGCAFWLDAGYGLSTQTNLDPVTKWVDRVANIPFIQTIAGSQPRLILNNPSYNNYPTIEAQSNTRYLQTAGGERVQFSINDTLVFAANYNTLNTTNAIIGNSANGNNYPLLAGTDVGTGGLTWRSSTAYVTGSSLGSTTPKLVVITSSYMMENGVIVYSGSLSIQASFDQLFTRLSATNTNLIGSIAEILIYRQSLSSTNGLALSNNINQKYAIY